MNTHTLKVFIKYADAIMSGTKTFEIRKNDRNFKVGDKIVFGVVSNEGISIGAAARHPLNGCAHADRQRDWMHYRMWNGLEQCPSWWLDQNRFERA